MTQPVQEEAVTLPRIGQVGRQNRRGRTYRIEAIERRRPNDYWLVSFRRDDGSGPPRRESGEYFLGAFSLLSEPSA